MITLLHGDCLDLMRTIEAGSVDLIATDLPYGTTRCKWDSIIPFPLLWDNVKRLLKPKGAFVTTASQPFTSMLVMSNPKWFRHEWVWDKRQAGNPMLARFQPLKVHESVLVFARHPPFYSPQMTTGRLRFKGTDYAYNADWNYGAKQSLRREGDQYYPKSILSVDAGRKKKLHPTQKPVPLFEYLIRTYSNPGETVLDCCMGSGTTGEACVATGRHFIGIEKERPYFDMASERIESANIRGTPVPHGNDLPLFGIMDSRMESAES